MMRWRGAGLRGLMSLLAALLSGPSGPIHAQPLPLEPPAAVRPTPFQSDTMVITHEWGDPLSRLLWSGSPSALWAGLPASVAVVVVPVVRGAPGASEDRIPPPVAALVAAAPRPVSVLRPADLPPAIRGQMDRLGHDQRLVAVEGHPEWGAVGLGDSGVGRPLDAPGARWALADYGHEACTDAPPAVPVQGRAVLIRRGQCPYVEKIRHARRHGAAAVLFVNNDLTLNRVGGTCPECADTVLAALPKAEGEALIAATRAADERGETLRVTVRSQRAWPIAARVGADGAVSEVGTIPYAFNSLLPQAIDPFESLAFEAQHLAHLSERRVKMLREAHRGGLQVLPVFEGQRVADPHWKGERTRVVTALPLDWLARATALSWELSLECDGPLKAQCPPWDYIVQMHLCEDAQAGRCNWEAGRWITPYWSGGSWLHDATPLIGLIKRAVRTAPRDAQGRALLTWEFHSIQPYRVKASLRFLSRPGVETEVPMDAQPLAFPGGAMTDGRYAERQGTVQVTVPAGVARVQLATLITGHGFADDDKCAEFCNTVHHFQVDDGPVRALSQPEAGTDRACALQVGKGVVPNQGGTWVYGRNGWCPGDAVHWRSIDISDEVATARARMEKTAGSATAPALPAVRVTIRYSSLVRGVDHHPSARNAQGREPDARLDVTILAVHLGAPEPPSRARGRAGLPGPERPRPARP